MSALIRSNSMFLSRHRVVRRGALIAFTALFFFSAHTAFAEGENITFPIPELGGCESKEQCKTFCDAPGNIESCLAFAEANNLMSAEEAATARKFTGAQTGPGGCQGNECRTYCNNPEHRSECIAFAREHGIHPPEPPRPGPRVDIDEPDIDEDRAMRIVEEFGGPGGCRTKDECRAFCDAEGNMEQCFAFAAEHNLMSATDLERARKMLSEGGPGGCRGRECQTYCEDPANSEVCLQFAEDSGFIEHEEAEKARKFLNTTGPGGCKGRECQTYCEDPAHQNECFEFALENGFISEEDAARMREFMEQGGPHEFEGMPPEGFERNREEFGGPGGCRGSEECSRYCSEHPDECRGFGPSQQGGENRDFGQDRAIDERGFQVPPGLPCATPEECHRLYGENPEQFNEGFTKPFIGPEGTPLNGDGVSPENQFEQYREQYPEQYPEQYREQYQQYQGTDGQFQQYQPPPDGSYPPPDGTTYPPPEEPTRTEPTSRNLSPRNFVASVLSAVANLLGF